MCMRVCVCMDVCHCNVLLQSDPYIRIELGSTVIKDRQSYVANELNPVFGK